MNSAQPSEAKDYSRLAMQKYEQQSRIDLDALPMAHGGHYGVGDRGASGAGEGLNGLPCGSGRNTP